MKGLELVGGAKLTPARSRLDALAHAEGDGLVALAYVVTGDREAALDAVQEVFARLARADLSTIENLGAYARRAVCHECASWGRSMTRMGRRNGRLEAEWRRDLATQPDPFGRIELMGALGVLSARQRTAVVLRYFVQLDDKQIAECLDCAPSTVRTLLSRAMTKLRRELR